MIILLYCLVVQFSTITKLALSTLFSKLLEMWFLYFLFIKYEPHMTIVMEHMLSIFYL